MRTLGRTMQLIGLVVLPLSMVMQLTDLLGRKIGLNEMLIMLVFGMAIFTVGWMIAGTGARE